MLCNYSLKEPCYSKHLAPYKLSQCDAQSYSSDDLHLTISASDNQEYASLTRTSEVLCKLVREAAEA